ncbi:MAG: hypothetical protein ACE37K_02620 [Planctomycetota bacterium]
MAARRRFSERLLLVVNVAVANGVAALWIATFLQPRVLGNDLGPIPSEHRMLLMPLQTPAAWIALFLAVGLLLWNFAYLVRRREDGLPDHWILSESSTGPVRVAREAVEMGLRLAGEALPEVTRLRVQVHRPNQKRLRIVGQFTCAEGQDHLLGSQRLRQALELRFGELVRVTDGMRAEFELEFQGFAGKLAKNAPEVPKATPAEPEPFRGPQYPIDEDDDEDDR